MNATIDQAAQVEAGPYRVFVGAFTALRIFTGLVWLSNGLAKLIDKGGYDWGFISFNLVTRGSAQSIANDASKKTYIAPLGAFYQNVVLPNWGFFGALLTVAELAIGLGLLFGVAARLAAVGGLLLIGPIWLMLLHTGLYLWQYPAEDLFPLVLLAIVPAGRVGGLDRRLAPGSNAAGRSDRGLSPSPSRATLPITAARGSRPRPVGRRWTRRSRAADAIRSAQNGRISHKGVPGDGLAALGQPAEERQRAAVVEGAAGPLRDRGRTPGTRCR